MVVGAEASTVDFNCDYSWGVCSVGSFIHHGDTSVEVVELNAEPSVHDCTSVVLDNDVHNMSAVIDSVFDPGCELTR